MEIILLNNTFIAETFYPEPYLPDIESKRPNATLEEKISASVMMSDHCQHCLNETDINWMDRTTSIMYYAIPLILTFGILTGVFNFIVCVRQLNTSYNVYILGFVIASNFVLITGWTLRLEDYIDHSDAYQYMYTYFKGMNSWFWYSSLWMLICLLLERFSTMLLSKPENPLFTPLQAGIITVLIFLVCCISAAPQFWEYQVKEVKDLSNEPAVTKYYRKSDLAASIGYRSVYFTFELAVSMFLPYPLMVIILAMFVKKLKAPPQSCGMSTSVQSDGSTTLNKDTGRDKTLLTRMLSILTVLYLLMTTPLCFLNITDHINPHTNWKEEKLFYALSDFFQFFFYSYYSLQIVVFFSFCKNFKYFAIALLCWCTNFKCAQRNVPSEVPV